MKLRPIASNMTELEMDSGNTVFFSYKTPVACHIQGKGFFRTDKKWSATTTKHINKWLALHGADNAELIAQKALDDIMEGTFII
jgi:hypothetical protein